MAMEPITIYARRIDPRGVAELLRTLDPTVEIVGPDDAWESATLTVHQPGEAADLQLLFHHDPDYYDGADWARQMLGMRGYFERFPDNPRKIRALRLIGSFRFALATSWEPDLIAQGDARLPYLAAVVRHLDGALFTPSSLRDAEGLVLYGADGDFDEDALFPNIPEPESAEVEDEAEDEPQPPTPERVVRRAQALTAVSVRALLEQDDSADPGVEEFREAILNWIDAVGIGEELEPDEWEIVQRPVGRLEEQQQINATWRLEGLAVLAWALGRFELPPPDELVIPSDLAAAIGFLDEDASRELLANPTLRSSDELDWQAGRLLGLHWRLRDFTLRPEAMDFRAFARECWFGSFDLTGIPLIDNDLALGGVPLTAADPETFSKAYSAARERHLAINWLHGQARLYSQTETST